DRADALAGRGKNLEAHDLIMIILARRERFESRFGHAQRRADQARGGVDGVKSAELDQPLALVRACRLDLVDRMLAASCDDHLRGGGGIERIELEPALQAVGGDDLAERYERVSHRRRHRGYFSSTISRTTLRLA